MLGRGLVPVLVGVALLASGCTQQGTQGGTPAPDFTVKNIPPSPPPGAAGGGGGLVPGGAAGAPAAPRTGAATAPAPTSGAPGAGAASAASLGGAIVNCAPGTPWEYTSGSVATPAGYKATYTIGGKTFFKGAEFCKVSGKVEATSAGIPAAYLPSFDYYFKTDPTGAAYADIWYVYTIAGQTQEVHVLTGAGGAAVSGVIGGTTAIPGQSGSPTTGAATSTANSPCLQKLTLQEIRQVWPAKDTLEGWKLEKEESTPGGEQYLKCKYSADLSLGPAKAVDLEFYKLASVVGWANNYEQQCSTNKALGQEGAPAPELGTNCISTLGDATVLKGSVWVRVICGSCTRDQLVSITKIVVGRL